MKIIGISNLVYQANRLFCYVVIISGSVKKQLMPNLSTQTQSPADPRIQLSNNFATLLG